MACSCGLTAVGCRKHLTVAFFFASITVRWLPANSGIPALCYPLRSHGRATSALSCNPESYRPAPGAPRRPDAGHRARPCVSSRRYGPACASHRWRPRWPAPGCRADCVAS
ncbi:hypothetical protein [Vibrio phage VP882]|uniref:Uncharacterized protein n=1 Tax=Vibrio phage VP882 TaxID=2913982 RepID=A2I2Y6_9CAUD|nr:hypothetical protein VPVV882_gp36 [Vibrio phage VP882]ABM73400.1 hypothetical protein [Vibrio phage VP882]